MVILTLLAVCLVAPVPVGADLVANSQGGTLHTPAAGLQSRKTAATSPHLLIVDSATVPSNKQLAQLWTKKLGLRIWDSFHSMIFAIPFWVALIFTLTLERIIPAEPNRKIFSAGLAHDVAWFLYEPFLHTLILWTYIAFLAKVHELYFPYLTFSGLTVLPGWCRFVFALLLLDLGYWVQHYINHKVPFLWKLHSVHHSQRELNFFTDFRYHPLEYIVRHAFITLPFLILTVDPPVIVGFAVAKEWYSRFYHGNIRTNLGPLKYILVTPQSHRVHHSLEERHRDTNFGAIFSFWDFLFGMQYKGFEEYPATGIDEKYLSAAPEISLKSILLTPWRQMLRPLSVKNLKPGTKKQFPTRQSQEVSIPGVFSNFSKDCER
jgi:sterol desaturase/sphingolipid hydroxylase (fatty acid hydroxylase superfamily)